MNTESNLKRFNKIRGVDIFGLVFTVFFLVIIGIVFYLYIDIDLGEAEEKGDSNQQVSHVSDSESVKGTTLGRFGIEITPSIIKPNDSYRVTMQLEGAPYSGEVFVESTQCNLNGQGCKVVSEKWGIKGESLKAIDGVVNVPENLNLPEGLYLNRFKPYGRDDSWYSDFDMQMVMREVSVPDVSQESVLLDLPPKGSYMLYETKDSANRFLGYSRIDIESDPCKTIGVGGVIDSFTMRFTKSNPRAYWNSGSGDTIDALRWCVVEKEAVDSAGKKIRVVEAVDGAIYRFPQSIVNEKILVKYRNSLPNQKEYQGLLGSFVTSYIIGWDSYLDKGTYGHYMLYPLNRYLPANLPSSNSSNKGVVLVNRGFGNDSNFVDLWHLEAFAPNVPGSAITYRQVETGYRDSFKNPPVWAVSEDWTFRKDGILTQIIRRDNIPAGCWEGANYTCNRGDVVNRGNFTMPTTMSIIESYIPSNKALSISYRNPKTEEITQSLTITAGDEYELLVKQNDGTPYSGFLELKMDNGQTTIWYQVGGYPVYVSSGSVIVGQEAYGNLGLTNLYEVTFSARPYLVNSSVNGLSPKGSFYIGNASTASYSNPIYLQILPRSSELLPVNSTEQTSGNMFFKNTEYTDNVGPFYEVDAAVEQDVSEEKDTFAKKISDGLSKLFMEETLDDSDQTGALEEKESLLEKLGKNFSYLIEAIKSNSVEVITYLKSLSSR